MARAPSRSSARGTSKLPRSAFAYPSRRAYPINTPGRARSALARASSSHNAGTYQHVARAVRARYGNRVASVGPKRGTVTRPGYRKH
ncbi:MAG TPA: hypothetical protein VKE25_07205 [Actinomycetes bacterium]|nr:hypothetical protein [Actinomycetes bacterium]